MSEEELAALIGVMRQIGNDTQSCEVKEAVGGMPSSLVETLSAFSNGDGGTVVLGVSERDGFIPARGFDARRAQEAFCAECAKLTPCVRPSLRILPFEGTNVLVALIAPMAPRDKPCYVTTRGRYQGSFVRSGDGDRRLTQYEVDRMLEEHRQPRHDDEIVAGATVADLDPALTSGFISRQRELHPRVFAARDDAGILAAMHAIRDDGGTWRPTLGGLLALGSFPQQFMPRLNVTFTAFPGIDKTGAADGRRFLDARTLIGPIPMMVDDAVDAVARNMRVGAVVEGAFRRDVPDYPRDAVREAVANALMHRDYSPEARGSQVQVNLYADRLEIVSPGGLYGGVTVADLGRFGVSSSRNQFLSNMLETTPYPHGGFVVENRGTGYQVIDERLREALMPPARPLNSLRFFSVAFDKRRVSSSERHPHTGPDAEHAILDALARQSSISARELSDMSGLSRTSIANHLRRLIAQGLVEQLEPGRSPRQRYRLSKH